MDVTKVVDYAAKIGLAGILIAILYLGSVGVWVWGSQLKEEQGRTVSALAERDRWQKLALQGTKLAEDVTSRGLIMDAPLSVETSVEEVSSRLQEAQRQAHPGIEP